MFRRTAEDLKRAAAMIADHPAGYVVDRFVIEGMPRPRAEWLVRRVREERRRLQLEKPREYVDWDSRGIVPEELKAAPPRNARIAKSAMRVFFVLVVMGVTTLGVGIWQVFGIRQLHERGIETRGTVGSGKLSPPYTLIQYRYDTPAGTFHDMSIVPWSDFGRLETGQSIVVTYARSPWVMSRPFSRGQLDWFLASKIAGFQFGSGIFFLATAVNFIRAVRRQSHIDLVLATGGTVAVGEVLGYRMPFFRVRYRFNGIEAETSLRRPPSVRPQAGDRVVIVYDPADPNRNAPADVLNVEFAS